MLNDDPKETESND